MHLVQNRINPLKSDHFVRGISQKDEIIQRKKNTAKYGQKFQNVENEEKMK